MRYFSTRGGERNVTFKDVLFRGYASDGGMFLPETVPQISAETLRQWASLSFQDLAFEVASHFLTEEDIPSQDLKDLLQKSFTTISVPEVVPITKLANGLVISEMFHGPTLSFKDLSMCCVASFLNYFLCKENKHITLICCTSGDTGSSAIQAVKNLSNIDLIVIMPRGRITAIQERQMTTVLKNNVHVFRVDGSSDDGDVIVLTLFGDTDYVAKHNLGSTSSLNFCRIMIQMVNFFYTYLKLCPEADKEIEFILPTGGGGNVTAGSIARRMGLPIRFVCAVNHNNALSRFMETGQCDIGEVECTIAPAIDIQFPYNFERVWYMCSDDDSEEIKRIMADVYRNKIDVPTKIMDNLRKYIKLFKISGDEEVKTVMKRCWEENSYNICPHTAVGVAAYYSTVEKEQDQEGKVRVVLATASPIKFPEAARLADIPVPTSDAIEKMMDAPTSYTDLEKGVDWVEAIKNEIEEISARTKSTEMNGK